jgi:hypothetical protein
MADVDQEIAACSRCVEQVAEDGSEVGAAVADRTRNGCGTFLRRAAS